MKKLFTFVVTVLLGASLVFAQTGSTGDTGKKGIVLPPRSETTFPCTKIGGKEPTKVTFVQKAADGSVIQENDFVLTFDDPVPGGAPVAFNNSDKEETMTITVVSNITGRKYSLKIKRVSDDIDLYDFTNDGERVVVFVCRYKNK